MDRRGGFAHTSFEPQDRDIHLPHTLPTWFYSPLPEAERGKLCIRAPEPGVLGN